jgi:hypothetical protein
VMRCSFWTYGYYMNASDYVSCDYETMRSRTRRLTGGWARF